MVGTKKSLKHETQLCGPCYSWFNVFKTKIDENFANYFLKTEANNKCFIVLKCTCKGLQKI